MNEKHSSIITNLGNIMHDEDGEDIQFHDDPTPDSTDVIMTFSDTFAKEHNMSVGDVMNFDVNADKTITITFDRKLNEVPT